MIIETFPSGPFETNAYILVCPEKKECVVIDPAPGSADSLFSYIEEHQLKLQSVILTHSHWDHIGDVARVKKQYQVPVYIHELDAPNLQQPGVDGLPTLMKIEGVEPDRFLREGDTIRVGTKDFVVIETPGHTPGGICLYCDQEKLLISGDTLFQGSIGNLSFPTADPDNMWISLGKLAKLPPETRVYPGHGFPTTIGEEPWLSRAKEIFGYE